MASVVAGVAGYTYGAARRLQFDGWAGAVNSLPQLLALPGRVDRWICHAKPSARVNLVPLGERLQPPRVACTYR